MLDENTRQKITRAEEEWIKKVRKRYKNEEFKRTTRSEIEVKPVYHLGDVMDREKVDLSLPGQYPFTRGIYPIHYQYQPWMDEQIIGFGTPNQLRERMDHLLEEGGSKGYFGGEAYNIIFDQATYNGYDPDAPEVQGTIGDVGVSICKTSDFETLFEGKDLGRTHVSLVDLFSSPELFALFVAAAERLGCPKEKLSGNLTNYLYDYIFLGYTHYPARNCFKLIREVIKYCTEQIPLWNTLTVSEHNIGEAGANAVQSVAYSMAVIIATIEECVNAGLNPDDFVPRLGFHLRYGENFFEDIAKTRALRRMYASVNKERFGCQNLRSLQARIHAQSAGVCMTVQQPLNNLIRGSIATLSAVLSGVNGMTVDAYDEALGEPTEEAVTLAVRTSQIIANETGVTWVSDPLGGSYYIEWLTDEIERRCYQIIEDIEQNGGLIACLENDYLKNQTIEAAYKWRQSVESGERVVIGVNKYISTEPDKTNVFQPDPEAEKRAIEDVVRHRQMRDNQRTRAALELVRSEAKKIKESSKGGKLMDYLVAAAHADATIGEMHSTLTEVLGTR